MPKGPSRRVRRDEASTQMRAAAEKIREALSDFENAKSVIEELRDEMTGWHDNMPESLQNSEQGTRVQECAEQLETATTTLDDIDLDDIASKLDQAAEEADTADFPAMYNK